MKTQGRDGKQNKSMRREEEDGAKGVEMTGELRRYSSTAWASV